MALANIVALLRDYVIELLFASPTGLLPVVVVTRAARAARLDCDGNGPELVFPHAAHVAKMMRRDLRFKSHHRLGVVPTNYEYILLICLT